ncbi:MAG: hypothetical protein R3F07_12830 [Opitutaceae bacterium]
MNVKRIALIAALCVCPFFSIAQATVLRVVVVKTADVKAYAKELEAGRKILKDAGSTGVVRSWVARYAGEQAGSVVVSIEYADMTALATDYETMDKNADYAAWLKGLAKMREIVSDSIYEEL